MRYRLKDQELQTKLDALCEGKDGFSASLQAVCEKEYSDLKDGHVLVRFGPIHQISCASFHRYDVWVKKSEIDIVPEYDPNSWNKWPDIRPPKGIPMKVKKMTRYGCQKWCCRAWEEDIDEEYRDGAWCLVFDGASDEVDYDTLEEGATLFFKPWDEPDEEGKKDEGDEEEEDEE